MYSALSTTPLKQHYTHSVTRFAWSWLHSGSLDTALPNLKIVMLCFLTRINSVHVTTIVTGGVQSRIARTDRALQPGSLYSPIENEYLSRVKHSQHNAMPNDTYARSVVSQVLYGSAPWRWLWPWARGRKSWIWEGRASWLIWILSGGWAWSGLFGRVMTKMFKLWKIKNALGK